MKEQDKLTGIAKRFCLTFIPLLALTTVITAGFLLQELKSQRRILLASEHQAVELLRRVAVNDIKSVLTDLLFITTHTKLRQMLENDQPAYHPELPKIFVAFCKRKAIYDQVRFLDETGMERIRINFAQGRPYIVADDELLNKAKRYYFADTFKLEPGQVFVSPMDLNIEHGRIEQPLKPMIRFGTPVADLEGRKRGIVLFNYFGAELIQNLHRASVGAAGNSMLLNSEGCWLKGFHPEDEWGFMYKDRKDRTLARRAPRAWQKISAKDEGQFSDDRGIYTFATVWPLSHCMQSSSGSGEAFKPSDFKVTSEEYYWKIVSLVPSKVLGEMKTATFLKWLSFYGLVMLLLGFVSWRLALASTLRKQAGEALKKSHDELELRVTERSKELNCLYGISKIVEEHDISIAEMVQRIVNLIPYGWQYPEITCARINLDDEEFKTGNFKETIWKQSSDIVVHGEREGVVEVYYLQEQPEIYEGPFLKEERGLIFAISERLNNIVEYKNAEKALQESENQIRLLLDSTAEGIYGLDMDGKCTFANHACIQFLGYKASHELIGKNMHDLIHHSHPDGTPYPIEECRIYRSFQKGTGVHVDDEVLWRAGGTCFPVEYWSYPVIRNDKTIGSVVTFLDITERKIAEEALLQSEEKYRDLYDNAPDMFCSVDSKTANIIECNQTLTNALGYTKEEIIGRLIFDLYTPDSAEYAKANVFPVFVKTGTIIGEELQLQRKDGSTIDISLNITAVRDEEGNIIYSSSVLRDIARQKELELQLQQSQKMEAIGTLAGGIAHDFNNILTAIMGYAEMTEIAIPKESEAHQTLGQVLKASHRAKDLVKQILGFARQSKEEKKPTKVGLIAREVLKLLRASLPSTIEIRHEITARNDTVMADPIQIHQVLMNLCTNAHYAMGKKGGVMEISLSNVELDSKNASQYPDLEPGSYVKLTVSDTGPGMDQGTLEKIFDPYFTTKEKGVGTGMGLAVVHGITKSHRGAITVQSKADKGSTFQALLPLVEMEFKPQVAALKAYPLGNERILFVDDEEPVMDLGKRMLGHLGYDVVALTSSMEALAVFREKPNQFDLVITDQTMPGLTGEMLTKEVMRIRPDIPVILCTGFSEHVSEEQAKDIGIRAFLMKPLLLKDISQTVRRVLDE